MSPRLAATIALYGVGLALWAIALAASGRPLPRSLSAGLAALEVACLLQVSLDVAGLLGGHRPASLPTHVGYLAASLAVLPIILSARPSRGRADAVVVALAALAVAIVALRLDATWAPARA